MKFKFCPECGVKFDREYKFCPECGAKLDGATNDSQGSETTVSETKSKEPFFTFSDDTAEIAAGFDNQLNQINAQSAIEEQLKRAFAYCLRGRFKDALDIYNDVLDKDVLNLKASIGIVCANSENYEKTEYEGIDRDIKAVVKIAGSLEKVVDDDFKNFVKARESSKAQTQPQTEVKKEVVQTDTQTRQPLFDISQEVEQKVVQTDTQTPVTNEVEQEVVQPTIKDGGARKSIFAKRADKITVTGFSPEADFDIEYNKYFKKWEIKNYKGSESRVVIPETINGKIIERIYLGVFKKCKCVKEIVLSKNIIYCYGSSKIKNIYADSEHDRFISIDGVLFNCYHPRTPELAYYPGGRTATEYTISQGVKRIGSNAFNENTTLRKIIIPIGVEYIDECAFEDCKNLVELAIPASVKYIRAIAFGRCTNLAKLTIDYGVKAIRARAFANCTSLTELYIPDSVTELDETAFQDSGLKKLSIPSSLEFKGDKLPAGCQLIRR